MAGLSKIVGRWRWGSRGDAGCLPGSFGRSEGTHLPLLARKEPRPLAPGIAWAARGTLKSNIFDKTELQGCFWVTGVIIIKD